MASRVGGGSSVDLQHLLEILYVAFMTLEKTRVDRDWGKSYEELPPRRKRKCARKKRQRWLVPSEGGSVMSPWLFNLFMDEAVREVNVRVLERQAGVRRVYVFWGDSSCLLMTQL